MREAIFTDHEDVDPRTVVLVSLAKSTGLLGTVFDRKELKARKDRIERLVAGEVAGEAARKVIEEMQTLAAIVATTVAVSAATSAAT